MSEGLEILSGTQFSRNLNSDDEDDDDLKIFILWGLPWTCKYPVTSDIETLLAS